MSKKAKTITKELINSKLDEFKAKITEAKQGKRKSPAQEFLESVSDTIKEAINSSVSYRQLSKIIEEVYNFKVSEQTIRSYAHNVLGIAKKSRNMSSNATAKSSDKVEKDTGAVANSSDNNDRKKASFNDI